MIGFKISDTSFKFKKKYSTQKTYIYEDTKWKRKSIYSIFVSKYKYPSDEDTHTMVIPDHI